MYEVKPWQNFTINEREVERKTAAFVSFPGGKREGIATEYSQFFDSASDAVEFCVSRLTKKADDVRSNLRKIETRLAELNTLAAVSDTKGGE